MKTKITLTLLICLTVHFITLAFNGDVTVLQNLSNPVTATFAVKGNCEMCKKTIEKAASLRGTSRGIWNEKTGVLSLTYNSKKTNPDQVLRKVALAGYDNEKYLAPGTAYNKLPECCRYERSGFAAAEPRETAGNQNESTGGKGPEAVYAAYFELKDALVNDDAQKASAAAGALAKTLATEQDRLKNEKDLSRELRELAEKIAATKETDKQRKTFSLLSDRMFSLMKKIKPEYPVYLEHCPMFANGEGANWISRESVIKNPYYGKKMLSCGKVTETLK